MDFYTELLYRAGPLVVFGVVFISFVYVVTQRPGKRRR